jgi:hypothetical protein
MTEPGGPAGGGGCDIENVSLQGRKIFTRAVLDGDSWVLRLRVVSYVFPYFAKMSAFLTLFPDQQISPYFLDFITTGNARGPEMCRII